MKRTDETTRGTVHVRIRCGSSAVSGNASAWLFRSSSPQMAACGFWRKCARAQLVLGRLFDCRKSLVLWFRYRLTREEI